MSFYFVAHRWDVKDLDDGLMVAVRQQDLDPDTIAVLDDELMELVRESGHANLCVDLHDVSNLPKTAVAKLMSLDATLRAIDCRLRLCDLDPMLHRSLPAGLKDKLECSDWTA